jgi:hypothetical protein
MVLSIKIISNHDAMEEDPGHAKINDQAGNIDQGSNEGGR